MELKYVDEGHAAFAALLRQLGQQKRTDIACVTLLYEGKQAVGCAAWRTYDAVSAELCHLYVAPEFRRRRLAQAMIEALETHAAAFGCHRMLAQMDAENGVGIAFFTAEQYDIMREPFADGCCMEKEISDGTMR